MTGEVVKFYPANAAAKVDNVLEQAVGVYSEAIILGYDHEGHLEARSSLGLSASDALWIIELFKHGLLAGDYSDDE